MISVHELVAGPTTPEKPKPIIPIFSEEQIRKNARAQIDDIVRLVAEPIRIGGSLFGKNNHLFDLSTLDVMSTLYEDKEGKTVVVGKAPQERVQDVTLALMESSYGFNPNVSHYTHKDMPWKHADGTSREILAYPSQTIPGLQFQRWRDYYTETGKTIWVRWEVADESPRNRVNLKTVFERLKPQKSQAA